MSLTSGDRYPEFVLPEDPVNVDINRCAVDKLNAYPRITIIRLAAFGDVLMATPLLSALRTAYPKAYITWIVERHQSDTIIANPNVDEVLLWEGRYWKRLLRRGLLPVWLLKILKLHRELQERGCDIFISLQPEEWPLLTRSFTSAVKIGVFDTFRRFNRAKSTSRNVKIFDHSFTAADLPGHRTDQYLLCLKALGLTSQAPKQMTLGYMSSDDAAATNFLSDNGLPAGKEFVVVAPRATWPTRCWPAERYVELCDRLLDAGFSIILIGSSKERDTLTFVSTRLKTQPIVADGSLTFRQIAAIISRAALVVSGDTGPMHAAAALGTPFVALFGSTSPSWYGPLAGKGKCLSAPVPCGPCDQKLCVIEGDGRHLCLNLITVDQAYNACIESLSENVEA